MKVLNCNLLKILIYHLSIYIKVLISPIKMHLSCHQLVSLAPLALGVLVEGCCGGGAAGFTAP